MKIWFDGCHSPQDNMDKDRELLQNGKEASVRFYTWPWPSCTWGVCVRPFALLKEGALERLSISHAARPTGGGLLFHGTDLAFSVYLPEGYPRLSAAAQDTYDLINGLVLEGLRPYLPECWPNSNDSEERFTSPVPNHLCQAKVTQYDLSWAGKKIGGCAERRTKKGMLHQTSLFVQEPDWQIVTKAIMNENDVILMRQASAFLNVDIPLLVDSLSATLFSL